MVVIDQMRTQYGELSIRGLREMSPDDVGRLVHLIRDHFTFTQCMAILGSLDLMQEALKAKEG